MTAANLALNDLIDEAWTDNLPRGVVGVHTLTTAFNTSAAHTTAQAEGLTVTYDDVAGKKLKFIAVVNPFVTGGANGVHYQLQRDGVAIRTWTLPTEAMSTTIPHSVTFMHEETIAATHAASVYRLMVYATTNNTAVVSHGGAAYPRQLIIEDCGA
jgi:uncharacterized protein (UPF0333 family)